MESQLNDYRQQQAARFRRNPSFLEMQRQQEERDLQYAKELAESMEREQKAQQEQSQKVLEKDEEMAKRLQEEEQFNIQESISNIRLHPSNDESEDENILRQLEEEGEETILEEEGQQPRITTSEQNSPVQSSVLDDEEMARRLQHEELLEARNERQHIYRGPNVRIPGFSGFPLPPPVDPSYFLDDDENITDQLIPMPFTMQPFPDVMSQNPILERMREMTALRNRRLRTMPRNMVLPGFIIHNPNMSTNDDDGEIPTDYESLLRLGELMQPVNRGATKEQLNSVPVRTFSKGSIPEESAKCGICLQDYEDGELLNTLPQCLHHFHKTCCDKWLSINKVCPVCRQDIEPDNQ